jgi:hypothetical protein
MLLRKFFLLFLVTIFSLNVFAAPVGRESKRKEIVDFIVNRINSTKDEYPLLKDFNPDNPLLKNTNFVIAYSQKNIFFNAYFGSAFDPKTDNASITDSFFLDELGGYIHCNITGDPSTVDRIKGILQSIPAIKNCTANGIIGVWDDCHYMI